MFSCLLCVSGFCFFKQKTAYEMRISDWSSDVCSSDLGTVVSWISYSLPVTSRLFNRRAVSFSRTLSPWVQCGCKSDYTELIYRMQRDAKCLICKISD